MGQPIRNAFRGLFPRLRRHRVLVGVLLLLVLGWFLVPQLFAPMIRGKLQGMISGHLDARLQIGRLMYSPPFGVRARDVRLVAGGAAGPDFTGTELLKIRRLDLKLARSPFHRGPLVIQNITVVDPEVHLVRTVGGRLVGLHDLVRGDSPSARAATLPAASTLPSTEPSTQPAGGPGDVNVESQEEAERDAARAKLSDMFELRHFGIRGGRFVYEDHTRPGLPPVVWKDLDVGMETTPQSKGAYGYTLDAENGGLGKLKSSGSFDLDALRVDVGSLHVEARAQPDERESPLPAQVQQALRDYRVRGRVTLDGSGTFLARDRNGTTFHMDVALSDASAYSPRWDATLDRLALGVSVDNRVDGPEAPAAPGRVRVTVNSCEAASGDTRLRLDKASVVLDREANSWSVADLAGELSLGGGAGGASSQSESRPLLAGTEARGALRFTAAADGLLRPPPGEYSLSPENLAFLVYPDGVTFRPPRTPAPIGNLGGGGSLRKDRGTRVVVANDLTFDYGGDPVVLDSARLLLPPQLRDLRYETRVEEIAGTIDFRRPGPRYPGKFGNVVEALRPVGPFVVGRDSWYAVTAVDPPPGAPLPMKPKRKADWFFSVSTDNGSFTLTRDRIPLTRMRGDATVSNMLVDVRRLEADVLGGRLTAAVRVAPGTRTAYEGRAFLRNVNLEEVAKTYILPETGKARLSGVGNLNIDFAARGAARAKSETETDEGGDDGDDRASGDDRDEGGNDGRTRRGGAGPALDSLRAAGEFEILRGDFWTIPVLGDIAARAGGGKEMTVGEAAGVFEVADRRVLLRNAAVSSPALGVQGSGTIGFDKRLDLTLVAAPLGDWRDKLRATNVPLVSGVAGELAGALQKLVNTTTSNLLYEFRVTGTTSDPDLATVPVPALTDGAAALFGAMLRGEKEGRLLESVKGRQAKQGPTFRNGGTRSSPD